MSETKAPVGYLFQMTCDCGNGKNLVVSGNFDVGADAGTMNGEVDKINAVFDRQRAKHEAPLIEERVEGAKQQLESQEADLAAFRESHPNLKTLDKQTVRKMELQIASSKVAITRGEITLAETQLKAQ